MNETETNNKQEQQQIDLIGLLRDFLSSLRRLWPLVLVLTVAVAALFYVRGVRSYSPQYLAEATVSVEMVNGGSYANRNTAEQMGQIFPHIIKSGALFDVIAADLGVKSVPGSISVTNIKGTNLLTISVTSWSEEMAGEILQSVMENYPEVAQYVVGQTKLTMVDEGGVSLVTHKNTVVRGSVRKGALLGLAVGLLLVVLRAAAFRTVRSEEDLRALLNVPCLGTLPVCHKKQRRSTERDEINILIDSNRGSYVEAMRLIRTRLERQMGDKKILMVTSSVAGEGKSTVAANLAISMALKGKKVILVDCDLRNPSVGRIFDVKEKCPGLVAVLKGKATLEEALVEIQNKNVPTGLWLLPGADKESRLVEILGSEEMRTLVDRLRDEADAVILDTPPSAVLVDAMMLVKHVDGIAYVVMRDYARRRFIYDGVEELSTGGAPIVGCILNGGRTHSGKYGYYGYYGRYGYGRYGYGYGYGYGKSKSHSSGSKSHRKSHKHEKTNEQPKDLPKEQPKEPPMEQSTEPEQPKEN
ncbi:MAG: polysaccharide biosynthesis tyrosine autokinase [Oscillospiraceae bacterium]|nr:polysaccharide biosynthesis tyrosine autokinase [Oscillospiraceae bacterium]